MNDLISAVLGEKQRAVLVAVEDYNAAVEAALLFEPDANLTKFTVNIPEPPLRFARRAAVSQLDIRELIDAAITHDRDVVLDYRDRDGDFTRRTVCPIHWRDPRFNSGNNALLVARDIAKNDIRHFRLDRIERVEDAA